VGVADTRGPAAYKRLGDYVVARRRALGWRQQDVYERQDAAGHEWVSATTLRHAELGDWTGPQGPSRRSLARLNRALLVPDGTVESVLAGTGQPDPAAPPVDPAEQSDLDAAITRVATFVRARRAAHGWTQADVYERLDPAGEPWISQALLSRLETGHRHPPGGPSQRTLRRASMALLLAPDELAAVYASADHGLDPASTPQRTARRVRPSARSHVAAPPRARDAVS
jgi:transcriptional regulator with XRE-family HTH domain